MSGLEERFLVARRDGRDLPSGDRFGTRYFVLDPANDPVARIALEEYAWRVYDTNSDLSDDLFSWLDSLND
jgi:hypothetical protein